MFVSCDPADDSNTSSDVCSSFPLTVSVCVPQTMPTDMKALQDFEEEDKLQIKMNDVITMIEGRSVCYNSQYLNTITGLESHAYVCQCVLEWRLLLQVYKCIFCWYWIPCFIEHLCNAVQLMARFIKYTVWVLMPKSKPTSKQLLLICRHLHSCDLDNLLHSGKSHSFWMTLYMRTQIPVMW